MITLALDTATDRCTVAAGIGDRVAHRFLDGSRGHAAAILGLIGEVLDELRVDVAAIDRVAIADGPGSFTGLRVAAAVAKGLAWRRTIEWRVAPSLLVRALRHAPAGGGRVLAMSDALRGEVYAAAWAIGGGMVTPVSPAPRAMLPEALAGLGPVDVVVGSIPPALLAAVTSAVGRDPLLGEPALPDARYLLALADLPGGTTAIAKPGEWEPEYGRPAEAQLVWERKHGIRLPVATGNPR